jgi:hypothetical protein
VRIGAAQHRRVAGGGDRERMAVVRVGEPGAAVEEAGQSIGAQLLAVARDLAHRQAVDDQEHHQARARRGRRRCRAR